MTTKHTSGPWRYEPGRDGRPPYVIRGTEGGFVVVGMTADRQEADARLISAAPELLEACMAMLEWDDREQDHAVDFNARMDLCRAAFDKARAATAKARGET